VVRSGLPGPTRAESREGTAGTPMWNACRGTPNQSAQDPYCRVSLTRHSRTTPQSQSWWGSTHRGAHASPMSCKRGCSTESSPCVNAGSRCLATSQRECGPTCRLWSIRWALTENSHGSSQAGVPSSVNRQVKTVRLACNSVGHVWVELSECHAQRAARLCSECPAAYRLGHDHSRSTSHGCRHRAACGCEAPGS
jgi:hypothetical protein